MASRFFVRVSRFLVAASFALSPANALAQTPSATERETARNLMDDGDRKRDAGDLKGALKAYESADAIMHVPTTMIDVARTLVALGRLLEARETLLQLQARSPRSNEPAPFAAARRSGDALLNDVNARLPQIQVSTNAEPGQSPQITIDGEPLSGTGPRKVNPGTHVIVGRLGSVERKHDVTVAERESRAINLDLKEAPATQKMQAATLSSSDGSVYRILMYAGFATAGVGFAVGAVTGLMSLSQTSELQDACPFNRCPADKEADVDSARSLGNVSTVAFIVAGAGLGAGIVGLALTPKAAKSSPAGTAHAVVGPSYVGLTGHF